VELSLSTFVATASYIVLESRPTLFSKKNFFGDFRRPMFALRIALIFQDGVYKWSQRWLAGGLLERTQVLHLCCTEIRIIFATQFEANVALEISGESF